MKLKTAAEIKTEIVNAIANCHIEAPDGHKVGWEGEWMDVAQRAAEWGDEWFIAKLADYRLADKGTSKHFFLATDIDANHTVMGYGETYDDAQKSAERCAKEGSVEIGDLDINEVAFTLDEDGGIEGLVRVDGGKCFWNLGNYDARQLAQDVRDAGLI